MHGAAAPFGAAGGGAHTLDVPPVNHYLKRDGGEVGTLSEVFCEIGSRVYEDEEIAVVETDKVALSVRASRGGLVAAVLCVEGEVVSEGQPLYALLGADHALAGAGDAQCGRLWAHERERRREAAAREADAASELAMAAWRRKRELERESARARAEAQREHWRAYRERERQQWWGSQQRGRHEQRRRRQHGPKRPQPASGGGSCPWAVLGLAPGASRAEIKAAFRRLALKYHPDRNAGVHSARAFARARAAYEVLIQRR